MSRIDRTLRRLVSQDIARANAAGASAALQERRDERDDVDAYLQALARDDGPLAGPGESGAVTVALSR